MNEPPIEIVVNGFKESVPGDSTIAFLIEHLQEGDHQLMVEHNGKFVHAQYWPSTTVKTGDVLEFIHPCFGG